MKRILFTSLILALLAMAAQAEEQTLFGSKGIRVGYFGGPMVYYTQFKGEANVLAGGAGGLTFNNMAYVGVFGAGIGHHPNAGDAFVDGAARHTQYEFSYGGGLLGVILNGDSICHVTADVMIGGGELRRNVEDWNGNGECRGWSDGDAAHFFALQPMAHVELNLVKWMRADLGAGYRFVTGLNAYGLTNKDARGPVAGLGLRFGKF